MTTSVFRSIDSSSIQDDGWGAWTKVDSDVTCYKRTQRRRSVTNIRTSNYITRCEEIRQVYRSVKIVSLLNQDSHWYTRVCMAQVCSAKSKFPWLTHSSIL
ncbi:hypothetical protein X797_008481 [Metarhizium robertsii]|uniref:Uncharacterized protein n=1 Tax=Metarhizium robertsii TaxID=568076 RepID=A0A0A1URA9_9HYPO|nr:hypothetical protein X797_008481 [Metarhizium robertsii]